MGIGLSLRVSVVKNAGMSNGVDVGVGANEDDGVGKGMRADAVGYEC